MKATFRSWAMGALGRLPGLARRRSPEVADELVFVGYASTMEAVQRFEWALKRLAVNENEVPTDLSFDEAWRRTEKLLRAPMGRLKVDLPQGLPEALPRLKRTRNSLAHEVMLRWRFETSLGLATNTEVAEGLAKTFAEFESWTEQVDALADQQMRDRGMDPNEFGLEPEEIASLLRADDESE